MKRKITLFYILGKKWINVSFQLSEGHSREGWEPSNDEKLVGMSGGGGGVDLKLLSYFLMFI